MGGQPRDWSKRAGEKQVPGADPSASGYASPSPIRQVERTTVANEFMCFHHER